MTGTNEGLGQTFGPLRRIHVKNSTVNNSIPTSVIGLLLWYGKD